MWIQISQLLIYKYHLLIYLISIINNIKLRSLKRTCHYQYVLHNILLGFNKKSVKNIIINSINLLDPHVGPVNLLSFHGSLSTRLSLFVHCQSGSNSRLQRRGRNNPAARSVDSIQHRLAERVRREVQIQLRLRDHSRWSERAPFPRKSKQSFQFLINCTVKGTSTTERSIKVQVIKHTQALPNCIQIHKRFQVSWEIFGPQITLQLAGQVGGCN